MLGLLRTTLALMVMIYHLINGELPLGTYAVFGFYIISGYLMTLIMHESYGYTKLGRYSFFANRFLRLYPQYWAAALVSIVLIYFLGSELVKDYHPALAVPKSIENIINNFGILFIPLSIESIFNSITMIIPAWHPGDISPRLVPPAWALTVEMFFYILICFGISKTIGRVKLWIFISICYVMATFILGDTWVNRYFSFAAASLPFSIGALIYFLSKDEYIYNIYRRTNITSTILFVSLFLNCFVWMGLSKYKMGAYVEIGFYLNIIICALLVYSLSKSDRIISINKKTDKIIGDFSYPIYLLHWQTGLIVSFTLYGEAFHESSFRGWISLIFSLFLVITLSIVFKYSIERPVESIRRKIKANKSLQQTLVPRAAEQ